MDACLTGDRQALRKKFEHWSCPSFAEWRWGSLLQVVAYLGEKKLPLRLFWNTEAMSQKRMSRSVTDEASRVLS